MRQTLFSVLATPQTCPASETSVINSRAFWSHQKFDMALIRRTETDVVAITLQGKVVSEVDWITTSCRQTLLCPRGTKCINVITLIWLWKMEQCTTLGLRILFLIACIAVYLLPGQFLLGCYGNCCDGCGLTAWIFHARISDVQNTPDSQHNDWHSIHHRRRNQVRTHTRVLL